MKKRLLGIIITVAMVICLMPISVSASTPEPVYELSICNGTSHIHFSEDATGSLGGGTYSYDYENAVLTLDNVVINIEDDNYPYGIEFYPDDDKALTIILKNTNIIISGAEYGMGINAGGKDVIIRSEDGGELIIKPSDNNTISTGIEADTVTFSGLVNVDITAERNAVYSDTDIFFDLAKGGKVRGVVTSTEEDAVSMCANCKDTIEYDKTTHIILADGTKGYAEKELLYGEEYAWFIYNAEGKHAKDVTVYVAADEAKPAGANTGDSNEVALFAIMGILALAGAGVAMKKREN